MLLGRRFALNSFQSTLEVHAVRLTAFSSIVLDLETCLQSQDVYFMCGPNASDPCTWRSQVCDGIKDCDDGSDEALCSGKFAEIN